MLHIKRHKCSPAISGLFENVPSPTVTENIILNEKQKEIIGVPMDAINFSFRLKKDNNINEENNINEISKVTIPKVTIPKVTIPKVTIPKVTIPKVTIPKVTSKYDFIFEYAQDEKGRYILPKEMVTPAFRKWCSLKGIKYKRKK